MWTSLFGSISGHRAARRVLALFALLLLFRIRELQSQASSPESVPPDAKSELVVLVDINADQQKVFAVEQSLATDVVRRLGEKGFSFSLISFGADGSRQIESAVATDTTLTAIRDLSLEAGHKKEVAPPEAYEALINGQAAFSHDASERALLIISGGRENLDGKRSKHIKSSLRAQKIACHVAIVSWHPLYGTKGIQVRGFYLHDLARTTHGKYVELGKSQKKVQPAAQKLVERILQVQKTRVQ